MSPTLRDWIFDEADLAFNFIDIMKALPSEVVVAGVAKVNRSKIVLGAEMLENSRAGMLVWVAVCITSDVYGTGMLGSDIFNEIIQEGQG